MWRTFQKHHGLDLKGRMSLFMDDHVIFFKDYQEIQQWEQKIVEFLELYNLKLGLKKTKFVQLKDEPFDPGRLKMINEGKMTNSYKYLGTNVSLNMENMI
jgi:hypothetical protein